jgi:hypothetical protein
LEFPLDAGVRAKATVEIRRELSSLASDRDIAALLAST